MRYPYRTHEENSNLLNRLESTHRSFKANLKTINKTRKWAVWQLQGAMLGIAYRAIRHQKEQQDLATILMMARLSREYLAQINYFANPNTKMDAIKMWWKSFTPGYYPKKLEDIYFTGFKKQKYAHKKLKSIPAGIDFSIGKYNEEMNSILSLWAHPSFDLTRQLFETDSNKGAGHLDHYQYKQTFYFDDLADLVAGEIIENAAKALHLGSYLYGDILSLESLGIKD